MRLAECGPGALAGLGFVERVERPQSHPALFRAEPVLSDPSPLAARPDANAKAGQIVIENDNLALAFGQFAPLERPRCLPS